MNKSIKLMFMLLVAVMGICPAEGRGDAWM
jgi:hypothetical protein